MSVARVKPPKTEHGSNPLDMDRWHDMPDTPDDEDWYIVNPGHTVATIKWVGQSNYLGLPSDRALKGDDIYAGSIVPKKAFGPGADIQRLVDFKAVRQASPWEVADLRAKFDREAGITTATDMAEGILGPEADDSGRQPGESEVDRLRRELAEMKEKLARQNDLASDAAKNKAEAVKATQEVEKVHGSSSVSVAPGGDPGTNPSVNPINPPTNSPTNIPANPPTNPPTNTPANPKKIGPGVAN